MDPLIDAASSLPEARRRLAAAFRAANFETPELDARLLVEGTLGAGASRHVGALGEEAAMRLVEYIRRRLGGEPVWRILGEREFWGLTFRLSPDTLEPRPDSETLVEAALGTFKARRNEALRVLDLGTGTGCLLLAILSEFGAAQGLGIDLSAGAVTMARANAAANGLAARAHFQDGDWTRDLADRFDLIVSNPPYIASAEIAGLDVAVRDYDPRLALDGGADGLDPYRLFAASLPGLLAADGIAILEIGAGQAAAVTQLMQGGGLRLLGSRRDLGGHERAMIFAA